MYADDTNLLSTICNFQCTTTPNVSPAHNINEELQKVSDWLAVNKLSLNVDKTKFMIFHTKQKNLNQIPEIKINDKLIERVESFKFLGVIIDQNLNWNNHVNHISNKLSRTCGLISRLNKEMPKPILKMLYNTLFSSHLNYGITAWGFHSCSRIIKLQKKAVRLISCSKYYAHTSALFKELGLLKFSDIFNLSCIKIYYKYVHNLLPAYFNNFFILNNQTPNPQTRPNRTIWTPQKYNDTENDIPVFNPTMQVKYTNTKTCRLCIRHKVTAFINENILPPIVLNKIETHSYYGFTQYAKSFIIDNYESTCNIVNCFVCSRN